MSVSPRILGMGYQIYQSKAGIIVGTLVLQVISFIFICLRFYTRHWTKKAILVSDWLLLIAFICATGLSVMEVYGKRCVRFISVISFNLRCRSGRAWICDSADVDESQAARLE